MTPHYLKFPDEATAITVMSKFRSVDSEGKAFWLISSHTYAMDIIGTHHAPSGVTLHDEDGIPYPELLPTPGFHINFLGDLPEEAVPYEVFPATPSRVFA